MDLQYPVGAGLQRDVKMRREASGGSHQGDEILGNVLRLDGAEAEVVELRFVENSRAPPQKVQLAVGGRDHSFPG